MHLTRSTSSARAFLFVVFALSQWALLVPSATADARGATMDKTGWWTRAASTVATPAAPVTAPQTPAVPEGSLSVSSTGAETTTVLAVGIQPDEEPGGTVNSFTMVLDENEDASSNQGGNAASLIACPIIEFWAGGEAQEYDTRPAIDCEAASAPGVRDDDGNWTFDLKPIGDLWFDPFSTIRADGVMVLPTGDTRTPFQVVVRGGEDIDIRLDVTPAPAAEDDGFALPPEEDAPVGTGSNSGGSLFSPPVVATPPTTRAPFSSPAPSPVTSTTFTDADTDEIGSVDTAAPPLVDEVATPVASRPAVDRRGDILGNWPAALFLLLPVFLALLAATSYWLGPAGNPATITIRQRGVSRALDAQASLRNRS